MNTFEALSAVDEMIAIVEGRVEGKTWIKGATQAPVQADWGGPVVHGMCLGGMIQKLTGSVAALDTSTFRPVPGDTLTAAIGKVIVEQYADWIAPAVTHSPWMAIVPFNDHPETTKDDIVRVLEKTKVVLAEVA